MNPFPPPARAGARRIGLRFLAGAGIHLPGGAKRREFSNQMRLYIAHITATSSDKADGGMSFWRSKRAAEQEAARSRKQGNEMTVESVECQPTKAGIIRLLNRYASHPDNG